MSHYDGEIFQTLLQRDGLGSNIVVDILTAAYGSVWIATEGGATRYRPVTSPPKVRITDVVTDEHHGSVQALSIPSTLLAIHFEARSFKPHPANMQFVDRLRGHDETWHSTREHFVEYDGLDFGQYTFELRAIDRDLTYSTEAATVSIDVHPPYDQWALVGLVIVALAFAGVSGVYARRRRRDDLAAEILPSPVNWRRRCRRRARCTCASCRKNTRTCPAMTCAVSVCRRRRWGAIAFSTFRCARDHWGCVSPMRRVTPCRLQFPSSSFLAPCRPKSIIRARS